MIEFPKLLVRLGNEIEWEGLSLAQRIVASAAEEAEAIAEGWRHVETVLKGEADKAKKRAAK